MVLVRHFFAYLLSHIFRFIPRRRNLIVYGGAADRFLDNAKYCFLDGSRNVVDFEHVWLTRNRVLRDKIRSKGYSCFLSNSFRGIWLSLRARFFIFDSNIGDFTYSFLVKGALTFNLWHGIPFKKIGYDNKISSFSAYGRNVFEELLNKPSTSPTWVLSPSESIVDLFSRSFRVDEDRVVVGGYYRTLPFSWAQQELKAFISEWDDSGLRDILEIKSQRQNSKFILYLPTFRDTGEDFVSKGFPDLSALNHWCLANDVFFLFKTHRATKGSVNIGDLERLIWLDCELDVYPFLPFSDLLITDYSSVFFDYALLNKPVLFYPFDLNEYKESCRGFNFDFEELIASSPCVFNYNELLEELNQWDGFSNRKVMFFDRPKDFSVVYECLRSIK